MIHPGLKVGPYMLQGQLATGGMGVVWRAWHAELDRAVAIKFLSVGHGASRERFRREARAIAHIRHPNVLTVHDFGETGELTYMVVDFLPGGTLAQHLRERGRPPVAEALALLSGLAGALDHAHAEGILHRDVKPSNILLTDDGTPIIADFGLAKFLGSPSTTSKGMTSGTPAYMAPEQILDEGTMPATDQYALATVAYELLTGVVPFQADTVSEVLLAQVHDAPIKPSEVRLGLPPEVDAVILRGLAKRPEERWPTCAAFVQALREAFVPSDAAVITTRMAVPREGFSARFVLGPAVGCLVVLLLFAVARVLTT
ncbi:MAG: serine/threonine protein kinase [Chloroflexi bacterium]|nr:MAG: serine/threonine protein kinase [Chloroflexota bacterium]